MAVIYAMADQHGRLDIEVPPCDLLLHAGDICQDFGRGLPKAIKRQEDWFLFRWRDWLRQQKVTQCLATLGNHDYIFTTAQLEGKTAACVKIDELVTVDIDGAPVKIWFSPWSKEFNGWAWMKEEAELGLIYNAIPAGTDIIVSHTPPYGYCDRVPYEPGRDPHQGSTALLYAIERVRPSIVICGHIHEGAGSASHTVQYRHEDGDLGSELRERVVRIYNVSIVDGAYRIVRGPTRIEL